MTGLYPHNHRCTTNNVHLSAEVPTIVEMVEGYRSAYMGKWHLGNEMLCQHGFDEWISTEEYRKYVSRPEYRKLNCVYFYFLEENGFLPDDEGEDYTGFTRDFCTRIPERFSKPAFTAAEASRFIRENRDNPFMLFINFLEPHPPYYSAFDDLYDPDEIDLPPSYGTELSEDKPFSYHLIQRYVREIGRHWPVNTEKDWRKLIARYWGAVSLVDKYTGKILEAVDENGLERDTIVVFTSDHGDMMGDFKMIQKGVIHDSASRVPLLIKVPGVTDGRPVKEPVSQVDLVPTLLDIMGLRTESRLNGKSLFPAIKGEARLDDNDVFIEWNAAQFTEKWLRRFRDMQLLEKIKKTKSAGCRAVVTPSGWKLSINQTGEHELYNLQQDPLEWKNLYFTGKHGDTIARLKSKITAWQKETEDAMTLP